MDKGVDKEAICVTLSKVQEEVQIMFFILCVVSAKPLDCQLSCTLQVCRGSRHGSRSGQAQGTPDPDNQGQQYNSSPPSIATLVAEAKAYTLGGGGAEAKAYTLLHP